ARTNATPTRLPGTPGGELTPRAVSRQRVGEVGPERRPRPPRRRLVVPHPRLGAVRRRCHERTRMRPPALQESHIHVPGLRGCGFPEGGDLARICRSGAPPFV